MAVNKEKLVVIGAGMAGLACIEEILKLDPERYEISMFGGEPHLNYNRVLLSHVLRGEKDIKDLYLHDRPWYETRGVKVIAGVKAVELRRKSRAVVFDDNSVAPYSKLISRQAPNPSCRSSKALTAWRGHIQTWLTATKSGPCRRREKGGCHRRRSSGA